MRILVVTPTYLPVVGGAEVGIYQIYSRLVTRHQVRILTPDLSGAVRQDETMCLGAGLDTVRFQDKWSLMHIRGHRFALGIIPPFSFSYISHIKRQIHEFSPDVINLHYALPAGLAAVVNQKLSRVPVVLSLIGRDVPGPGTPLMWRHYVRGVAKRCRGTIFISDYCKSRVFGTDALCNSRVIPYGVDIQKYRLAGDKAAIRRKLNLPPNGPLVLAVQRLSPEKRVDVIVRAMGDIAATCSEAYLVIAGSGICMDELTKLVDSMGLSGRVRLTGLVSNDTLADLYRAADIFVFHSEYETFGVVLVEAMAAGLPIVTVNNTAIPELVEDGKNGILVPTYDHTVMADAIKLLIENADLRARMGNSSRKLAAQYDWEKIAQEYEGMLSNTIASYGK